MGQARTGNDLKGTLKPGAKLKCVESHHSGYKVGATYTFMSDSYGIICKDQSGIEVSGSAVDTKFEVLERCGLKSRLLLLC